MSEKMPTPEELAEIQSAQGADSVFNEQGLPEQPKAEGSVEGLVEQEIAHEEQILQQNLGEFLPKLENANADSDRSSAEKWKKASEAYQIMKLKISNYGMATVSAFTGIATFGMYKGLQADQFMKSIDIAQMQKYAELTQQAQDYSEIGIAGALASLGVIGLAHWYHSSYNPNRSR